MGVTQACVGKEPRSCSVFIYSTNKAITCFAEKKLFLDTDSMTWKILCFLIHLADDYFLNIESGGAGWCTFENKAVAQSLTSPEGVELYKTTHCV